MAINFILKNIFFIVDKQADNLKRTVSVTYKIRYYRSSLKPKCY